MKFSIVMICPPWKRYRKYRLASGSMIDNLPGKMLRAWLAFRFIENGLSSFTSANHIALVWAASKNTEDCKAYMRKLSYELHGTMIWVRPRWKIGTAEKVAEYLMVFTKGNADDLPAVLKGKLETTFTQEVTKRCQKPADAYQFIDAVFPGIEKLQIYGQTTRPGWTVFHRNEINPERS